ncbi:MAG: aerobic carbon-monoxide dehydrogenase large subunit [Acidimicrobiaceae bacterium]|nr:aerobic carbon-monoxide dehydrogenase large subunit [Acidimicrobiaceae bacterium]
MDRALTLNGVEVRFDVEPRTLLVDLIREEFGRTGTKVGCETGECGACTVLLGGKAVKSCMVLAAQADGASVTTIEGLGEPGALTAVQDAFWEEHAVQDGFTTPGLVMSVTDLLSRNPDPTEAEIRSWLDGNLERVTGYHNVVAAVESAARKLKQGDSWKIEPEVVAGDMVGASVRPREAPEMLRGETDYIADVTLPGMVHAAILRSPHGHATINGIDTSAAAAMPGVIGVFTAADLGFVMPLPVIWVPTDVESHWPPHPSGMVPGGQSLLATDRVRFVGDQVAVVVAETVQQANDALQAIRVDYEVLPAVVDAEEALKRSAPQLHETVPNNLCMSAPLGDKAAADAAIAAAEVVVEETIRNQRIMANTVEARGAIGSYDATTGDYTLWTNVQPVNPIRLLIALYVLGVPYNKLRVIAPAIGSSLGAKGYLFADGPLMLWLAKAVGRPVKWLDTRSSYPRSTPHGRDHVAHATLAGSRDGKISALSVRGFNNLGAYPVINAPGSPRTLIGQSVTGAYDIANPYYEANLVFTNTSPTGPVRGSGRAEAIYLIERMIDRYAGEIGMDPAEVRRINMVKPDQFPYDNHLGWMYDSGDYPGALDKALEMVGYDDLDARRADSRARGKRLGVGIGSYVAAAGVGPSAIMGSKGLVSGTWGSAYIGIEPSGEVSVTTGAQPHGQSQVTTFSQIVAQELGVPLESITVKHSDTNGALYYSQASYGSRSLSVEGVAVYNACQLIKEKARQHAAHLFHCPVDAVEYGPAKVFARFAPDQAVMTLQQIAFTLWLGWDLAEGMTPGLEAKGFFDPPEFNYPYGTHVAIVEVDEQTGHVELVRYVAVNDFGTVVNPKVVDAQSHGNIALGVGQALYEAVRYDETGALLTDSYSTYPIVRASELPSFELLRTVTPTPNNPLGAKGAGDVSNPPVAPAVVNAVCDALSDLGITSLDMPLQPHTIWRAMSSASAGGSAGSGGSASAGSGGSASAGSGGSASAGSGGSASAGAAAAAEPAGAAS